MKIWKNGQKRLKKIDGLEEKIHAAKAMYFKRKYGSEVRDFNGRHKPSYLVRPKNQETLLFYEQNKELFAAWVRSSALHYGGHKAEARLDDIIAKATLIFIYSRFEKIRDFERLAKYYGRCATMQTMELKP